eukprot:3343479-Karenia_brevis.AAC.1
MHGLRYSLRLPERPALLPLRDWRRESANFCLSRTTCSVGGELKSGLGNGSAAATGRRFGSMSSRSVSSEPGAKPADLSNRAAWLSSPSFVSCTACSNLAMSLCKLL